MRILAQQHVTDEQRLSIDQVFKASHAQFERIDQGRILLLLHVRGDEAVLELIVRVPDLREVAHGDDGVDALLKHIARLLKVAESHVVVGEGGPQLAHLIRVLGQRAANDWLDAHRVDLLGVLREYVAELHPEFVARFALARDEVIVVHDARQNLGGLVHVAHAHQVVGVLFQVIGLQLVTWLIHSNCLIR